MGKEKNVWLNDFDTKYGTNIFLAEDLSRKIDTKRERKEIQVMKECILPDFHRQTEKQKDT